MKTFLPIVLLALAGCQTSPLPPLPVRTEPEPRVLPPAPTAPSSAPLEAKLRQQAQYIDALISQNEALSAKLTDTVPTPASARVATVTEVIPAPIPPPSEPHGQELTPNADGVIDLTASVSAEKSGESVNPFAVRTAAGPAREVALRVSGILAGKSPSAVVNDRIVQVNETIEALTVERIESDGVYLRFAGQRLRVPVSDHPVKVKLPL